MAEFAIQSLAEKPCWLITECMRKSEESGGDDWKTYEGVTVTPKTTGTEKVKTNGYSPPEVS